MGRPTFAALVLFRLVNALAVATFFVPDEYYQGTEVAYGMVYGRSERTWEWQPEHRIRGFLHPLLLAVPLWLCRVFGVDSRAAVVAAPKVTAALAAAVCDWCTCEVARLWISDVAAGWAMALQIGNWFAFYAGVRCLSNGVEAALVMTALWLWTPVLRGISLLEDGDDQKHLICRSWAKESLAICLAVASVAVRPTAAVFWVVVAGYRLAASATAAERRSFILKQCLPTGLAALAAVVALDSWFYGRFTVALWNFLEFNVLSGQSALFGAHPWHWYLTQGVPAVLLINYGSLAHGVYELCFTDAPQATLCRLFVALPAAYIGAHSLIAHKEFRFLLPCLPFFNMVIGRGVAAIFNEGGDGDGAAAAEPRDLRRGFLWLCMLLHVPLAVFFSRYHQGGTIAILDRVHADVVSLESPSFTLDYLMPCYSAPAYSSFHAPAVDLEIRQLKCGPTGDGGLETETADFEADPVSVAAARYGRAQRGSLPCAIVIYDLHLRQLREAKRDARAWLKHYDEVACAPHAAINTDADRADVFREVCYLRLKR